MTNRGPPYMRMASQYLVKWSSLLDVAIDGDVESQQIHQMPPKKTIVDMKMFAYDQTLLTLIL